MKKLLVWDCDGTLWEGNLIAGDVPIIPEERIDLIKELYNRGVVQSIASWNLETDVLEVLERYGISQYFLYPQLELGRPKPEMLQTIKNELDLSKWEDVVFVDDEASHRSEAVQCFPNITTVPPQNIAKAVEYYFTKESYTEEDRLRVRRYEQERTRKVAQNAYPGDRIEFLKSCEIHLEIEKADIEQAQRVIDLIARANRMSAVALKHTEAEIMDSIRKGQVHVAHVWDRFGNYGLSAVTLTIYGKSRIMIEALVVSCRLQGKGIGSSFVAYHVNKNQGKKVFAVWMETEYNTAFYDMYKFLGFTVTKDDERMVMASITASEPMAYPEWIHL